MFLSGIDFQGLGEPGPIFGAPPLSAAGGTGVAPAVKPPKKKKEQPEVPPPLPPPPPAVNRSAVPVWLPYAVGGIGTIIVIGILITSKGKN